MGKLIGGVAVLVAMAGSGTSANAAAWCANYGPSTYNCGFHTYEQCLATIRGVGGYCSPNYREGRGIERRPAGTVKRY
jgi:cation transport regulator ChaC